MRLIKGVDMESTKPKAGRPRTYRDDGVVKLQRDLIRKARVVSLMRSVPMAQVLSELLAGPLDRAYADVTRAEKTRSN